MKKFFLIFFIFLISLQSSYAWFSEDFKYRREIKIHDIEKIQENFTINFTIDTLTLINNGRLKTDCSDFIIVLNNVEIDRDLINCNSLKTDVLFKLFNKSQTDKYYLYYGNTKPYNPKSNKANVYYFYDSFEDPNLSQRGWVYEPNTWFIDSQNSFDGLRSIFSTGLTTSWRTMYNKNVNLTKFIYTAYASVGTEADVWSFGISFNVNNLRGYRYNSHWEYQIGSGVGGWSFNLRKVYEENTTILNQTSMGAVYPYNYSLYNLSKPKLNQWYKFTVIRNYPNMKIYFNDTLVFDVRDSTYEFGGIGFSRYSNYPMNRTSWYDNVFVMLYSDPWPNVSISNEETKNDAILLINQNKIVYESQKQFLLFDVFSKYSPIKNITFDEVLLKINEEDVSIKNFKNYNNGTYGLEFFYKTNFLGKKTIRIITKYASNFTESYVITKSKDKTIIITNKDWKNYIESVSTKHPVLIYENSTHLIDEFIYYYKPNSIFILDSNISGYDNAYYLDKETMNIIFFKEKDITIVRDKETAIKASMIGNSILINPNQDLLKLINPKSVKIIENKDQIKYYLQDKKTNYIVLTNTEKENSIFAANLGFRKNAYIEFSSFDAQETKNILKNTIKFTKFERTIDFKRNEKFFLTLIDVPMFLVDDPVDDNKFSDFDGNKIYTDTPYADINEDYYLDLSVGRLIGSAEEISYQLEMEPRKTKNALIVSVYSNDTISNLAFGSILMLEGIKIQDNLFYFNATRLVEKRSEYEIVDKNTIKSKLSNFYEKIPSSNDLYESILQFFDFFSISKEIAYITLEFDIETIIDKMLKGHDFEEKHIPIYTEENFIDFIHDKDVIIYMAYGNKSHFEAPNKSFIKITSLPITPSLFYLYYTNSFDTYENLNKIGALTSVITTGNAHYQESIKASGIILNSLDQEIGFAIKNGKNSLVKFFKTLINLDFNTMNHYKKEYYTRNILGEPSKIYDPFIEFKKSPKIYVNGSTLVMSFSITPNYTVIDGNIYFYDADDILYINDKIIPIYSDGIVFPKDTIIENVYYRNNSKYFTNSTIHSQGFPEKILYYETYELLDNRKKIEYTFIPLIYYSEGKEIIQKIDINVTYKSHIEILDIYFKYSSLDFIIYSDKKARYNLTFFVESYDSSYNFTKEVDLEPGENKVSFNLNLKPGTYSVTALLEGEYTVGPRYTWFKISNNFVQDVLIPFQKIISNIYLIYSKIFDKEISIKDIDGKRTIEYKSFDKQIYAEIHENEIHGYIQKGLLRLDIYQNSNQLVYNIKSPEGHARVIFQDGSHKIDYTGDEKIVSKINDLVSEYNDVIDKLQKQYT
ncbi:MAG: hypothetical protein N3D75_01465 [Candidatus Aenigmarchaeota archaeon]|nr:hypothetical protein [Candidatus Aenigmarchaeota archaeon]